MLKNIRHTGLVVRDLANSRKFYEALGFAAKKHAIESGPEISRIVGIPNVEIETLKLGSPDGALIELLQYRSHPDNSSFSKQNSNRHGCSHIALTVKSAQDFCKKICDLGGTIVSTPTLSSDSKVLVAYCHDIDGILIEVVEDLDISGERTSK
jgi:catechol 2,3-dioxygenase-like lactoylglutathione lyase family enzyme